MNSKKLLKQVLRAIKKEEMEFPNGSGSWDDNVLETFMQSLTEKGIISFCVQRRETEYSSWIQSEYWSNKIQHTVILSHEWGYDEYANADELASVIVETERECIALEKSITVKKVKAKK